MAPNESLIAAGQKLRVSGEFTRATEQVHVVRRGDTLDRIARTYRVRLTALLVHNGLSRESVIRPGQKIRIPS